MALHVAIEAFGDFCVENQYRFQSTKLKQQEPQKERCSDGGGDELNKS